MRLVLLVTFLFLALLPAKDLPMKDLPSTPGLPDLFQFNDGSRVMDLEDWKRRREELKAPLLFYQYGRIPPRPDQVIARIDRQKDHASGLGTETWLTLIIDSKKKLEMRAVAYTPHKGGPHPVIVEEEGNLGGSKNAALFMKNNYLFIEYARHDLDPDRREIVGPAQKAYPEFDWATLAVWAWGGMRVVDYLESRDDVDLKRIAITGHSRGGKMALLAAALDERFALAAPNGSGAGGAGASRILGPGAESIGMNDKPHWYHERIQKFGGSEAHLPIDQHFLKALMAPRGLLCIESTDDLFANPVGTYATSEAVRPVYELYGKPHRNGIRFRRGGHTFSGDDWQALLDFAEWQFFDREPSSPRSYWQKPAPVEPLPGSGGEPGFVRIGDPGNAPDKDYPRVGARGSVSQVFEMGTHKVSNSEYAAFLNGVAKERDPHGLYHPEMKIARLGREGRYRYVAHPATARAAVTYVCWQDSLRYCNWLHGGDTEAGAYPFSGTQTVGSRQVGAKYFLPTENEWVKGAYYDPRSKSYTMMPPRDPKPKIFRRTPPPRSPNGMLGIEDSTWEWTETAVGDLFRCLRSDSWFQGNNRQACGRFYSNPELELGHIGFRVARKAD